MARKKNPKRQTEEQQESSLKLWLKERRITEVECLVPDLTGNARGKIIPAAKFSHDYGTRLPEGIFATTVTGDYPDEYDEIVAPSDSDMYLRPDADTVRMVPWPPTPPRKSSTTATPATAARTTSRRATCCGACWRCTRAWG